MNKLVLAALVVVSMLSALSACKTGSSTLMSSSMSGFQCHTQAQFANDPPNIGYAASCTDLVSQFPQIDDPQNPEDPRVLCPFLRILNRSKQMLAEITANLGTDALKSKQLPVSIKGLIVVAQQFGCGGTACGGVATQVSAGQLGKHVLNVTPDDIVDIGNLSTSKGVAHDCGFTFAYGETVVNPATRTATLARFKARAVEGRLTFNDIVAMKQEMCKRDFALSQSGTLPTKNAVNATKDSLVPSAADNTEVSLIFTYLGGVDNGTILYTDVERFFNAQMPANKTKYLVDVPLFAHLKTILAAAASK